MDPLQNRLATNNQPPYSACFTVRDFWRDSLAAVAIAGLLIPEALAYSSIAHLPAQAGIIALLCGLVVYAIFGKSRFAIASATSSSAAVLLASVASLGAQTPELRTLLTTGLVVLTGIVMILAAIVRLGSLSSFVSKPVLRGFAFGLAITIVIHQLPHVFEIHAAASGLFSGLWELLSQWRQWNMVSVMLAVLPLIMLRLLHRWQRIPAAFLAIVFATLLSQVDALSHIERVGHIPLAFAAPSLPTDLTQQQWVSLAELSLALFLVLFAESYASIRTMALRHGDPISLNRDLFAFGAANFVSGLLRGMPVAAGFSATCAHEAANPATRLAGALAAAVVLLLVLSFLPFVALIPQAVLAAIVIHALSHSLNLNVFKAYFFWRRDRVVIFASILAVMLLGVLQGLLLAIGTSLLLALHKLTQIRVCELVRFNDGHAFVDWQTHPQGHAEPGILILRPEAPLLFANADGMVSDIMQIARKRPEAKAVLLSLEETPDLDGVSIEALGELANQLNKNGQQLHLSRLHESALAVLLRAQLLGLPASSISAPSVDDAVASIRISTLNQEAALGENEKRVLLNQ